MMPIVNEEDSKRLIFGGQDIAILIVENNTFPSILFVQTKPGPESKKEIKDMVNEYEVRMDFDDVTYMDQVIHAFIMARNQLVTKHPEQLNQSKKTH